MVIRAAGIIRLSRRKRDSSTSGPAHSHTRDRTTRHRPRWPRQRPRKDCTPNVRPPSLQTLSLSARARSRSHKPSVPSPMGCLPAVRLGAGLVCVPPVVVSVIC